MSQSTLPGSLTGAISGLKTRLSRVERDLRRIATARAEESDEERRPIRWVINGSEMFYDDGTLIVWDPAGNPSKLVALTVSILAFNPVNVPILLFKNNLAMAGGPPPYVTLKNGTPLDGDALFPAGMTETRFDIEPLQLGPGDFIAGGLFNMNPVAFEYTGGPGYSHGLVTPPMIGFGFQSPT